MGGGRGKPKKAEASHCSVVGGFRRNSKGDFEEASMDVGGKPGMCVSWSQVRKMFQKKE